MILRLIFPRNVYDDEDDIADSHKHISATDSWNTFLIKRAVPSRASGELRNACHVAFGGGCLGGVVSVSPEQVSATHFSLEFSGGLSSEGCRTVVLGVAYYRKQIPLLLHSPGDMGTLGIFMPRDSDIPGDMLTAYSFSVLSGWGSHASRILHPLRTEPETAWVPLGAKQLWAFQTPMRWCRRGCQPQV